MKFAVLGPLQVECSGRAVAIPSAQQRILLATLLAAANIVVPAAELEFALWGERLPSSGRASLHNQMLRLRRRLGPELAARIQTVPPGYRVELGPGELDEQLFVDGCAAGRQALAAGDWARASRELADALALWHGDLGGAASCAERINRLHETRLLALSGRLDADLRLGRHHEVVPQIRALTVEHPLHEDFHGQLMLALYRCGRQAHALEVFQTLRRTLVDQLAVEPGPQVQDLHRKILAGDVQLKLTPGPVPFADGQLFLDLSGHTPALVQLDAGDALTVVLRALGAPYRPESRRISANARRTTWICSPEPGP